MPTREVHRKVDRLILGEEFPEVHRIKDLPAKFLGAKHRRLFHDVDTAVLLGAIYGPKAFLSALLHDLADHGAKNWRKT